MGGTTRGGICTIASLARRVVGTTRGCRRAGVAMPRLEGGQIVATRIGSAVGRGILIRARLRSTARLRIDSGTHIASLILDRRDRGMAVVRVCGRRDGRKLVGGRSASAERRSG